MKLLPLLLLAFALSLGVACSSEPAVPPTAIPTTSPTALPQLADSPTPIPATMPAFISDRAATEIVEKAEDVESEKKVVKPRATASPTPTMSIAKHLPLDLAAICSFESSIPKISCQATNTTDGSGLRWESNVAGWGTGPTYEVELLEPHQLISQVAVTLEECHASTCKTVEVFLDTSSIVPKTADGASAINNARSNYVHPGLVGCEEKDSVSFTHHATNLDYISGIYPSIVTSGNWLKPNSYVWIDQDAPIYAPSDATNVGLLRFIQYYVDESGAQQERLQFGIQLQFSCDIRIYFGHVEELVEPFASLAPTEAAINNTKINHYAFIPMEIKAGTLLGYARYRNLSGAADGFDFVMYNSKKINQFANQSRYLIQGDLGLLLHAECPFDSYSSSMRQEWSAKFGYKDIRPIGYDCEMSPDEIGTIAGGWFQSPHDPTTDGKTMIDWGLSIRIKSDERLNIGHPNGTIKVDPNDPTFRDPKTVVGASCFYDSSSNKFGFLKPIGDMEMEAAFGSGSCPAEMPPKSRIFYR